jgi:hypothetical protein
LVRIVVVAALQYSESIFVAKTPDELYELVSDVTRMGDWSPICKACWWDEGSGPKAGSWFTGRNETPQRTWETRSQVLAAVPGQEFTFTVGGGWVLWSYTFAPVAGGCTLTETWTFTELGQAGFHERYGEQAEAQIANRTQAAHTGIPVTLAAIKMAAEATSI